VGGADEEFSLAKWMNNARLVDNPWMLSSTLLGLETAGLLPLAGATVAAAHGVGNYLTHGSQLDENLYTPAGDSSDIQQLAELGMF